MARTPPAQVNVVGLAELSRALKRAPGKLDKKLGKTNRLVVNRIVRPRVRQGAPRRSGRLARSVRGLSSSKRAAVAVGSPSVPYAGPINFGWSARNIAPQEFIYKGIVKSTPKMLDAYELALDGLMREIFPD